MRDIAFGQYYPADSVIHKLDSRIKLILVVVYVVGVFLVNSFISYIPVALFLLSTILLSKVSLIKVMKSIKGILFIIMFTSLLNIFFNKVDNVLWSWGFLVITDGGLKIAAKLALRLLLLVAGTSMLTFTTTPMGITDGLESIMKPLKLIKVPVHDIAITMSITLRFIPILIEEIDKIIMAQKARGASFDTGGLVKRIKAYLPVLIPLFVSAFRRADELALAMDARCYNATQNRTKLKELKCKKRDLIALFITTIYLILVITIPMFFPIILDFFSK
ncbi:MAG: energy-coupling factor transporter transmembrane protein EcfT [Christensenellaceae bacterium]|jgi:energy-coupling factor transport system permease protein|nr:energy-coupling factor transporter transmembrane protein EcfT [Christensenellaceae bacterium]